MNLVILKGRVSQVKVVNEKFATFSLAVYAYTNKEGVAVTDFFECSVGTEARVNFIKQHVVVGDEFIVTGRARTGSYEKEVGTEKVKINTVKFEISDFDFNESKNDREARRAKIAAATPAPAPAGYQAPTGYQAPAGYQVPPAGYQAPAAPAGYQAPVAPVGYQVPPAGYQAPVAPTGYQAPIYPTPNTPVVTDMPAGFNMDEVPF